MKKQLGCKVQALRKSVGMTQNELATKCCVSWRTISNLERGSVLPHLELLLKISKEFNVSVDELLGYQIATDKSLSRLRQENRIVEQIKQADNGLLSHLEKYLYLVQNLFKTS